MLAIIALVNPIHLSLTQMMQWKVYLEVSVLQDHTVHRVQLHLNLALRALTIVFLV